MTTPSVFMPADRPILWPAEAVWEAVAPHLPGFTVEILPHIDSTNSELMRRCRGSHDRVPQAEPTLLVAEQQSAGRGRLGRHWTGERGASLMFSLGMVLQPVDWSGLSLAVGVSLADTLQASLDGAGASNARIGLKWPNDLWLVTPGRERKLAGVLVETAPWPSGEATGRSTPRWVVIGVGINIGAVALTSDPRQATGRSAVNPGSLRDARPGADAAQTLLHVVPPLVQAVMAFAQTGFAPFQPRFAARDVLANRPVVLSDGTHGIARGVTGAGALQVHTDQGLRDITSADVSVRPVQSLREQD